jgi:hypothetical protein
MKAGARYRSHRVPGDKRVPLKLADAGFIKILIDNPKFVP